MVSWAWDKVMNIDKARDAIDRAKRQLEKVQVASWEPQDQDHEQAVMWAFYAYENCVTALAELYGYKWTRNHREKADLARKFHAEGLVSRDIGDELEDLNNLRKDVAYGDPGSDLSARDLDELAIELEEFIDEVNSRIASSQ